MEKQTNSESGSDDEIFIGKLSLKEIKIRITGNKNREVHKSEVKMEEISYNNSLKIIETHSEPNLSFRDIKPSSHQQRILSNPVPPSPSFTWAMQSSTTDSDVQIEKNVLCKEGKSVGFDNSPNVSKEVLKPELSQNKENSEGRSNNQMIINYTCTEPLLVVPESEYKNTIELENIDAISTCSKPCVTPNKSKTAVTNNYITPCSDAKTKTPFRTPHIPVAHKKTPASLLKKTPSKISSYQHIVSPVASYINNSPIVPLLKNVRPTKPLPGPSAIPKLKSTHNKVDNKENFDLPTIAYKTAKKTKVIDVPDDRKLPQSQWAKKVSSSLPRPLVIRHDHRDMKNTKRTLVSQQEDSFADLTLQQADLSVHTQKSAFNVPKNVL